LGHRIKDFGQVIRNTILLGTIFILLHLASITEALSYISRPMVTHFVQLTAAASWCWAN
jgi:hypothetical protein